jgi:hypothetical protein
MRGTRAVITTLSCLLSAAFVGCGGELTARTPALGFDGPDPQMTLVGTEETDGSPEGLSHWNVYADKEQLFFRVRGVNESGEEVTDLWIPQELAYTGDELEAAEVDCLLRAGVIPESRDALPMPHEGVHTAFIGFCERQYEQCNAGCRRIRNLRARAICWAACTAQLAACKAGR